MAVNHGTIVMPSPSTYGAVEIKEWIRKYTWRAFYITTSLILLLLLFNWIYGKVTAKTVGAQFVAPISKIQLTGPIQELDNQDEAPPPPPVQQVVDVATAARAGTPVPVPDAEIKADLKEFANVNDLSQSLAKNEGQIVNYNDIKNIDIGNKPDVNITAREQEPKPDDFIAVEQEPQVDIQQLEKMIIYPEMARKAGIEGKVYVRVLVDKNGKPKKVIIERSDSQMLDQAAKDAIMKCTYTPAIQNGHSVICWVSIPVIFKLR